ncbi:ribosomal RNA-processing protein 14-C-like [Rhodamnia argentea]|uniref:Ribosomal RNA-processing protein 14-C-like n=1 Tax=Rhodamnia argentea TaxID=178133 RepID=A0ABM3HVA1_9MYRT|nr:ribosomal RNA-processing protein 14-C-like [Rhodamnia argentea]XP_048140538.1 ribosomal RNA-processing protein 14-C-like [Rhodamnia argentea]
MKKKKQKSALDSTLASDSGLDLKSLIHQHSLFFDKLIELVPAKFYLPSDDKDKPWFQGLSKDAKASAKKESMENIKKARRERLDPERSSKTTLDLLKESLDKEKSGDESKEEEVMEPRPTLSAMEGEERSATYEELRQRLHRKIQELRGNRNTRNPDRPKQSEKKQDDQKKRKRDSASEEDMPANGDSSEKIEEDASEAAKELALTYVKLGDDGDNKKKKRKVSKLKELEKAKRLEEAKKDPDKGERISWKAATSRAAGLKVHDDPKLLKKSIKKEKKQRQKNAGKWKERIETTEKMKSQKQQKRSDNIAERAHDKKMRRIAKREKKLLRPGFEGRKEGYINQDGS